MMLPIFWIVFGILFYKKAQKMNARPWAWVGVMAGASLLFFAVFAVLLAVLFPQFEDRYFGRLMIGGFTADALFIIALLAFMTKRVPFKIFKATNDDSAAKTVTKEN